MASEDEKKPRRVLRKPSVKEIVDRVNQSLDEKKEDATDRILPAITTLKYSDKVKMLWVIVLADTVSKLLKPFYRTIGAALFLLAGYLLRKAL